ncbi:hypothetical protein SAP269_09830 [Spiroplasma ixodetis]|uniref:Spiroplasmavirus-related protein n=1 Tax=Spiroplasma ixodetis TaxID=2141 RepID=A0ABM8JRC4_9MOLU
MFVYFRFDQYKLCLVDFFVEHHFFQNYSYVYLYLKKLFKFANAVVPSVKTLSVVNIFFHKLIILWNLSL